MTTPTQTGDKPMVTQALKPCPFCGGEAKLTEEEDCDVGGRWVVCLTCGAARWGDEPDEAIAAWNKRAQETLSPEQAIDVERAFALGQRVGKIKGSNWQGRVVGFYSTALTPVGYAVESEREPGSVQIYPESALAALSPPTSGEEMRLREENEQLRHGLENIVGYYERNNPKPEDEWEDGYEDALKECASMARAALTKGAE